MTLTESIIQACVAALQAGNTGATVYRGRTSTFGASELPAINVKPETDDAQNYAQNLTRADFNLNFEIHATHGDAADQLADPIMEKLHQALLQNTILSTLCAHIQYKARRWEFEDGDGSATKLTATYVFIYMKTAKQI